MVSWKRYKQSKLKRGGVYMKKWKVFLAVLLTAAGLTGCSQFKASQNTVKLNRDGSLQTAVIEELDKSYYSEEELKTTIDDAVAEYNGNGEEEPIVIKKYEVEEGVVSLYMNYASAEDYQEFNQVTLYAADLQGAYDNSFQFPETFQKVEKGKITGTAAKSELLNGLNYYVLIYSEDMDVEVPGNIVYVSRDVTVTGKKTATNRPEALKDETVETEKGGKKDSLETEEGSFEVEEGTFETENGTQDETENGADTKETEETENTFTFIVYE